MSDTSAPDEGDEYGGIAAGSIDAIVMIEQMIAACSYVSPGRSSGS